MFTAPFNEKKDQIFQTDLFDIFSKMPKPVVHHTHLTATADANFLVELTYIDRVYYSERENLFFVSKNGCNLSGYMLVNHLR